MTAVTTPDAPSRAAASVDQTRRPNPRLRDRPFDWFFIVVFSLFIVTSMISDMLPTLGVDFSQPSPNFLVNANHWYAHDTDPLFMIASITGIIVFGVEFFGEPEFVTPNPAKFLAFNLPYVLIPIMLLVRMRMRKPMPFTRKF